MSETSVYHLPQSLPEDLEQLRQMTAQFEAGEIPAARYQAFRVPQGVYEQRESGTYMLRARLASGILTPAQMRVAAETALEYGNGVLHFTSRQDMQVHGVRVNGIYPGVAKLTAAGLATKGGGGNTVRNIAACPQAGVCAQEFFDVTPHVISLTESLLPDPLSFQLPRKYKIAFSGCGADCAGATINDLGLISRVREGVEVFAIYVGGGMGAQSRVGQLLEEFVPAADVFRIAEAVKRVFDQHGNRKNRSRARIRFLIEDIGFDAFVKLYRDALAGVQEAGAPLRPMPAPALAGESTRREPAGGFAEWRESNVTAQKQPGRFTVEIAPPLGVIEAGPLAKLADVVERNGEGVLRASNWQTVLLRWVSEDELPGVHADLAAMGLANGEPALLRHMVTCAGAATCRLGMCLSRGLAEAVRDALTSSDLELRDGTGNVTLHISGCPNSCGRHGTAQIGLSGAARRINGRLIPHYMVHLGGHVEEGQTRLAAGTQLVPARNIPAFLIDLLREFRASAQHPDFDAFLEAGGREAAGRLALAHAAVEDDRDWGSDVPFSLAGRGPGECGAGVFDLIAVDLDSAEEAIGEGRLLSATVLASRALLVTRGEQSENDRQSLEFFRRLFLDQGLIAAELRPLIERAETWLAAGLPETIFDAKREQVASMLAAVRALFACMGPSLRTVSPRPPAERA